MGKVEMFKKSHEKGKEAKSEAPEKKEDLDAPKSAINKAKRGEYMELFGDQKMEFKYADTKTGIEYDISLKPLKDHVEITYSYTEEGKVKTKTTKPTFARVMSGRFPTAAPLSRAIQERMKRFKETKERYNTPEKIKPMVSEKMARICAFFENMDSQSFKKKYETADGKLYTDASAALQKLITGIKQRVSQKWPDSNKLTVSVNGFEVEIPTFKTNFSNANEEVMDWLKRTEAKHGIRRS